MTDVTSTPPALRWVALFLAACAVLGLFLGVRDQIRKNPPGWYTGAEQVVASPLATPADGAREAVAFDPGESKAAAPKAAPVAPAAKVPEAATAPAETTTAESPPEKAVTTPAAAPAPKPRTPPPTAKVSGDPVGDILEGQKQTEPPVTAPY